MCDFCDAYKWRADRNNAYHCKDFNYEYTVAFVERQWLKGMSKRTASRSVGFKHQGKGYELNYCPECGKALNEK